MHELLVIGNGFDLACGLASRLSDYERYIKGNESKQTIWDINPEGSSLQKWQDTETEINNIVEEYVNNRNNSLYQSLIKAIKESASKIPSNVVANYILKRSNQYKDEKATKWINAIKGIHRDDRKLFFQFLSNEVHRFEQGFTTYLKIQVKSNKNYKSNSIRKIQALVQANLTDNQPSDTRIQASILNFNYTHVPIDHFLGSKTIDLVTQANIHGSLTNNDIILGINGIDLMHQCTVVPMDTDLILPFSKEYRVLNCGNAPESTSPLIYPSNSRYGATSIIKFYGHSLGEADYPYFEALFDAVDLYAGETKLIFYFSTFDNHTADELRTDMTKRVSHLLMRYGETLDNKNHGRNLIPLLELEGRLEIKEFNGSAAQKVQKI